MLITLTQSDKDLIAQWQQEALLRGATTAGASTPLYNNIRNLLLQKLQDHPLASWKTSQISIRLDQQCSL
jgi:hypothetical protein